jgi:hypothetical protein
MINTIAWKKQTWKNTWSIRWLDYNNAFGNGISPKHESCLQLDKGKNEEGNVSRCKHTMHQTWDAQGNFGTWRWKMTLGL